jgi:hypothetical protein
MMDRTLAAVWRPDPPSRRGPSARRCSHPANTLCLQNGFAVEHIRHLHLIVHV